MPIPPALAAALLEALAAVNPETTILFLAQALVVLARQFQPPTAAVSRSVRGAAAGQAALLDRRFRDREGLRFLLVAIQPPARRQREQMG